MKSEKNLQKESVPMQDGKKEIKITKTFNRKISANYDNSVDFATILSTTVRVGSAEELETESDKVFEQAKKLTMRDIEKNKDLIEGALESRDKQTW